MFQYKVRNEGIMLDRQVDKLRVFLQNEKIIDYAGDAFWNLIQAIITADPFAGIATARDIKNIIFHMPTLIFWDKMKRYLLGTFNDYDQQIKMSEKFGNDNKKYNDFVKRQIYLIDQLDDDLKVDYFSNLTRSFLLVEFELDFYFKLAKLISNCTCSELEFLKKLQGDARVQNNTMVSFLYQRGLFIQCENESGKIFYKLSDLAKALKQNCLNFDDGIGIYERITSYGQIKSADILMPNHWHDLEELLKQTDIKEE